MLSYVSDISSLSSSSALIEDCSDVHTTLMSVRHKAILVIMFDYVSNSPRHPQFYTNQRFLIYETKIEILFRL